MNFDLIRPCKDCPFRTDVVPFLRKGRAREILDAITVGQKTFACHKTTKFDEDGDNVASKKEQHCAGATIMLERLEMPNQMMRIAERFGMYDRTKLEMDSPVYATPALMLDAYGAASRSAKWR